MNLIKNFSARPILVNRLLLILWAALSIIAGCKQYLRDSYNNYKIFKYVFINTTNQHPLYEAQPEFFLDMNHYGPVFSLVIAPFALLPNWAGIIGWALFTSLTLFYAINKLPLSQVQRNLILLICTNELFTSLVNLQSNSFIAALIILTFVYAAVNELKSGFFIALGLLVKLYGIVGFAFILFAKSYWKYIAGFLFFLVIIASLPAAISSFHFQIQAYQDWFRTLSEKNGQNITEIMQNISAIGLLQRTISSTIPVIWVLGTGLLLMLAMVVANFKRFNNSRFRFLLLSAVLLFTVLFSTGSESSTYIIAFPGVAIWYVTKERRLMVDHLLFILAIFLTSLSPTDIFPPQARLFIKQYSLKALPCLLIWLEIIRESIALRLKPAQA
ncbi:MAG: rane protein [Sphingobacteriaceae bacterium]|jgi:hypothetical protein|nr:rane protein [Sphingobacteriaceae bacterium]